MYVVVFGEIHLVATTPARGARLTGVVGPGQSFGEPVMFLERTAVVDAQAATDALVLRLPADVVFIDIDQKFVGPGALISATLCPEEPSQVVMRNISFAAIAVPAWLWAR